jgi:hypothetical protein
MDLPTREREMKDEISQDLDHGPEKDRPKQKALGEHTWHLISH